MKRFATAQLLLSLAFLVASVSVTGAQTTETYGTAPDGTILHWSAYTPMTPGPWPIVLIIHGGRFQGGDRMDNGTVSVANDLVNAGYLALSIDYRLAPPGKLPGQTSTGQKMEQYDDVKMAVRAARADPRGNGRVAAVGGSAGGTHATWVALTSDPASRVDVAVSLSGAYDFDDFSADPYLEDFKGVVTNFCGVANPPQEAELTTLQFYSPVTNVDATVAPILLVNSLYDSMPFSQLADMTSALRALGVANFETLTVPGAAHSFDNWTAAKSEAMNFIATTLANVNNPPTIVAPTIDVQPRNRSARLGASARFSVAASGSAPLLYQWLKDGVAIDGATASTYATPPTTTADHQTFFSVIVSNSAGSVTSQAARLTVKQ
ncbi:hypothetical protein BH20VER3_BH20VER3_09470 [soil metagenome]